MWGSEALALQEEEPCESSSEEESGSQDYQSLNSVVDVEDLGNIVSPMKREKVLFGGTAVGPCGPVTAQILSQNSSGLQGNTV